MSSRVIKEWVEGKFPEGFEVIDIGAGTSPALGATRAVDSNPKLFTKRGKLSKKVKVPDSLVEYANYDASNLPYSDEFFDRGISRWAIGPRIEPKGSIRELYRVLKPGGRVYIGILEEDWSSILEVMNELRKVGFHIITTYTGVYEGPGEEATEYIIYASKPGRTK